MAIKIKYSAYTTMYQVTWKNHRNVSTIIGDFTPQACFTTLFSLFPKGSFSKEVKLEIIINTDHEKAQNVNRDNYMFLTPRERKLWMCTLQTIIPFEYKFNLLSGKKTKEEHKRLFEKGYLLTINVKKLNYLQCKFLTTAIRYFYEYPYHILLKEAIMLKAALEKSGKYADVNLLQCLNLTTHYLGRYLGTGNGHSLIPCGDALVDIDNLNQKLSTEERTSYMHDLFNDIRKFSIEALLYNQELLRHQQVEEMDKKQLISSFKRRLVEYNKAIDEIAKINQFNFSLENPQNHKN